MKNIDYLGQFFKKHNLSGRVTVRYTSPVEEDDYMSDIIFEDGITIHINDVIFDIESDLPADVGRLWMEEKKENDISLMEWIQTDVAYLPRLLDRSPVEEYQKELTGIFDEVKERIQSIFELEIDEGDSDSDEDIESRD